MRSERVEQGRSINMTLSTRGLHALENVGLGLVDAILQKSVPVKGRMIHAFNGELMFQLYGKNDDEILYSFKRHDLNIELMNLAQTFSNVKLFFNKRCVRVEKNSGTVHILDQQTNQMFCVNSDFIIGADGAFSTIRQQMQRGERADYYQEFLDCGYKELTIPSSSNSSLMLENKALHIWPRGKCLLLAWPNLDSSLTCTLILPFEGDPSFASLKTESDVLTFFKANFDDVITLIPTLVDEFLRSRTAEFTTINTSRWYYNDRIVLLGDACHAVYPFYGQGMNAAFEDCLVLNDCIGKYLKNWELAFMEYQKLRKPNTDILAQLSKQNFVELRDKAKSPLFIAQKEANILLNRLLPKLWFPLYTLIVHTTMPYSDALKRYKLQNSVAKLLGIDVLIIIIAALIIIKGFIKASVPTITKNYKKLLLSDIH
ncbi:FAD-dependent oxidoreductase [uncultured Nostoc sp.]|uniref:FAD-dependent oxidoreductase n=1 Tax=uncultured Nostoc sp. TaxID=340711 RepID=UPI0035CB35DE